MERALTLFYKIKSLILVSVVAFVILKLENIDSMLPLIVLCSEGGGSAGGGCGGSSCGNGNDGDGGGDGSGGTSTPFLCTWNGKRFVFENDFLFGEPHNFFQTSKEGRRIYENSFIEGDLYKIKNSIHTGNQQLKFQIKEIEPEESFIDSLSLLHVVYPKDAELIVDSKYKDFFVFDKKAIEKSEGIKSQTVIDHNSKDVTHKIGNITDSLKNTQGDDGVYKMETGDSIQIKATVEKGTTNQMFLLLGSHYRDWTMGEIFNVDNKNTLRDEILSMFTLKDMSLRTMLRSSAKVVMLTFILSVVWVMGSAQNIIKVSGEKQTNISNYSIFAMAFGAKEAHADASSGGGGGCRSLVVEYWNGDEFQSVDVVSPRYYQSSVDAVLIPQGAILDNNKITVRVTATKKHNITSALLVAPKKQLPYKIEKLSVNKAFHNREQVDYAHILNKEGSKQYLHTIPADVIDLEFNTPQLEANFSNQTEAYLIKAKGFYTAASKEAQQVAGDWVNKLDPEAREWLKGMYALKDYDKNNREPVLS